MIVTLRFSLPEQSEEYESHFNGPKYQAHWEELQSWVRNKLKHEDLNIDENEFFEILRAKMTEIQEGY